MAIYSFKMENISRGEGQVSLRLTLLHIVTVKFSSITERVKFVVAKQHIKRTLPLRRFLHLNIPLLP